MFAHPQHGHSTEEVARLRQDAGRWLRSLREEAGLSQRQLADKVGIDYYTFISQIEAGRGRVPPERYEAFARALNISAKDFVLTLMRFYDPITHDILFGSADATKS